MGVPELGVYTVKGQEMKFKWSRETLLKGVLDRMINNVNESKE